MQDTVEAPKRIMCIIDEDSLAPQIAEWARAGLRANSINEHIREIDPTHRIYSPSAYSKHRTGCLGMGKMVRGRGLKVNKQIDQTAGDLERAGLISNEEGIRLAKSAFFDRLKRHPADIATKDLVSVISALSRGGAGGSDPSEQDKITQAMGDLDGNEAPPAES